MAALTEAQLRICAQACITRYDQGDGDIATIIGSYALDAEQREKIVEIISFNRSNLVLGNIDDPSSSDVSNKEEETVKWYSNIFRKKTI